jgi:plastocyanin
MHAARYGHTATVLTDGRVLIAGGYGTGPLSSAEIYDPAANTWTTVQPMAHPRWQQSATRLSDGRVLVVSGQPDAFTLTAEIYDPTDNTWSPTGNLAAAHGWGTLTVLPSGQVLVAGGSSASDSTATLERYDPATNGWTTLAPMATARTADVAVALKDGELLVAGGFDVRKQDYLRSVEIYNPASNTWRAGLDSTSQHAIGPVGALLPDGSVLLAAGRYSRSSEIYEPADPPSAIKITVTNTGYSPKSARVPRIGTPITWTKGASAKSTHTVTESIGLCAAHAPLFSSGPLTSSFSTTLNAAGTYSYHSVGKGDTMRGSVAVPMSVTPAAASHATTFHFSWAKTLPCGAVEDIAMRYQAPKSKKWSAWQTWLTGAPTPGGDYMLNLNGRGPVPGTYDFRARLRNPQTGAATGWSPIVAVTARP